jgi:hypothetical protein
MLVWMVVAWASLALTCTWISAAQSTLLVVEVPEVEVELAELVLLDAADVVVEPVLLIDVMTVPPN